MTLYRFSLIVTVDDVSHDAILDATDSLAEASSTDASIRGHNEGMELLFEQNANSLELALASAIKDVEKAGYRVAKLEMERDFVPS
jgi:hypothetical protein